MTVFFLEAHLKAYESLQVAKVLSSHSGPLHSQSPHGNMKWFDDCRWFTALVISYHKFFFYKNFGLDMLDDIGSTRNLMKIYF